HDRAHVAVGELEPGPGKRVRELIRIRVETPQDLFVSRVEPQGEVGGQHGRRVTLRGVVRIRYRAGARAVLRFPLVSTGRTLGQFPLVAEQVVEEAVAPFRWAVAPDHLDAAGDRVTCLARAIFAGPSEPLLLDVAAFGLGT